MTLRRAFLLISAVVLLGLGVWLGLTINKKNTPSESTITSNTVVTALQKEGFLVTQGYLTNERVMIGRSTGNPFKDFFFGQTIEALGMVRVSSGVDLKKVTSTDVLVEEEKITVTLPPIETYGAEVMGDITVVNKEGVVKRVIDHDDGYNVAANELRLVALRSATKPEVREQAEKTTQDLIQTLVESVSGDREVIVQFR